MIALLAVQVFRRVRFPWDAYVWSDSPFLTNMGSCPLWALVVVVPVLGRWRLRLRSRYDFSSGFQPDLDERSDPRPRPEAPTLASSG